MSAAHEVDQLEFALDAFARVGAELGIQREPRTS
jgi:hypothetical protein